MKSLAEILRFAEAKSWVTGREPAPDTICLRITEGDRQLLERALGILHRMATENTGWRGILHRWYYNDEPLRHDAANLVREAGFDMEKPAGTKLIGEYHFAEKEQARKMIDEAMKQNEN